MTCGNCTVLRDQVRRLERELGLRVRDGQIGALVVRLGVYPMGAQILNALYEAKGRFIKTDDLIRATGIANEPALRTQVCFLRKNIGGDLIQSVYGSGYCLTPAGMSLVFAAVQPPEPQDARG